MMKTINPSIDKITVSKNFSLAAFTYDQVAVLQREIGHRLMERLDYFKLKPKTILDLGSGTGYFTRELQKKYPKATIISLDIAEGMIHYAKKQYLNFSKDKKILNPLFIIGDAEQLSIKNQSIDLIFSNCTFQWCAQLNPLFLELRRVLNPQGLLLFSTFGPDTLKEFRYAFASISNHIPIHHFTDMHDIGDILLQQHFKDPVMDSEFLTLNYENFKDIRRDLRALGASFAGKMLSNIERGNEDVQNKNNNKNNIDNKILSTSTGTEDKILINKNQLLSLKAAYETFRNENNELPVTFEVLYGQARGVISNFADPKDQDFLRRIPIKVV